MLQKVMSKEIDIKSQQQTSAQNRNEQPASSGIRTQINIKLNTVSKDFEKPIVHSSSLSSLDKLAARLKEQLNKDDIQRPVGIKTNNLIHSSENLTYTFNLKKNAGSRSLNELSERLQKLKNDENSSTGTKIHTSVSMAVASESTRSRSNSISSLENLFLKERVKEDESFVTVEPCQKEKMTGTDAVTVFSMDNRTQNIIVARSDYTNRPPPPYEYTQRYQYQGNVGQTPVYQMQTMSNGIEVTQDASRAPPYRAGDMDTENLFNNKKIRKSFVRKVYMILAVQLLFTFGFITFSIYNNDVKEFMRRQWLAAIILMIIYTILLIALFCYTKLRRIFPLNFILLFLLTVFMTFVMAFISCYYNTEIVMISMGVTAGICTLLTLLSCTPWFDITGCGMMLCIASSILLIYGIIAMIITMLTGSNILFLIYACLITLLFCIYLMYDTQQILGGRRVELSPEEYILGALTLYVDIMVIFQYLLSLISKLT